MSLAVGLNRGTNDVLGRYIALPGPIEAALDSPIKGSLVQTDLCGEALYAGDGAQREKILLSMPQLLAEPVGIYARYTRGAGEHAIHCYAGMAKSLQIGNTHS